MIIFFDEKEYEFIEIKKSSGGITISISAKDMKDILKTTINSAEITQEEFVELISDLDLVSK